MLKRKKIISKLIATTMITTSIASMFVVNASALSVSSSTLAGANRYETAVKISESGWTTATNAILINGDKGLVDALTATPYASSKNAPILITGKDKLTAETKARLTKMNVKNVDIVGGTAVVSTAVENELKGMGITVKRIAGKDRFETSVKVAEAIDAISDVSKVAVVNGWTGLPDAVSIAAPAADNNMPILLSDPKTGVSQSKAFIDRENISRSYVIGQTSAVSDSIMNSLPGTKTRLGGTDRHDTNTKVIREFYSSRSLDNIYVAKSGYVKNNEELVDALAVGVLAAKNDDPVLIVGKSLGDSQKTLLAGKEFTKITQVGNGIPTQSINDIKNTQADVESKVTSVNVINYKTIELVGTDLDKLSKSDIYMSGNTVSSYTVDSSTRATVVFTNAFNNGTNTVKVTSNLGNTSSHNFTYGADISSVQATTKEVGLSGIQHLEFTVNGSQKRTIEELKALGWNVEFRASENVFYNGGSTGISTSPNGKLITSLSSFGEGKTFSYEVVLTKGSTTLKSAKGYVDIVNKDTQYKDITSFKLKLGNDVELNSKSLVLGETAEITDIKGLDKNNKPVDIPNLNDFRVESSNSNIVKVDTTGANAKKLQPMSKGNATITITNGVISEKFTISVVDVARKHNTISLSSSNLYLKNGVSENVVVTIKDQYGDPFKDYTLVVGNTTSGNDALLNIASGATIAKANMTNKITNEKGQVTIPITAEIAPAIGSSSLVIKNLTNTWATINVSVSNTSNITNRSLTVVPGSDSIIDKYSPSDNEVVLDYKEFSGSYIVDRVPTITKRATSDTIDSSGYQVRSTNDKVASIKANGTNGQVTIVAEGEGTATIEIYEKTDRRATISITVRDSSPKITNIDINNIDTITKGYASGSEFDVVGKLFDITIDNGKNIVSGLTLSGTNEEVLLGVDNETTKRPVLYVDKNGSKTFNEGDLLLGTIDITTNFGSSPDSDGSGKIIIPNTVADGEIVVRVYNGKFESSKNPLMTTSIKVKIPQ